MPTQSTTTCLVLVTDERGAEMRHERSTPMSYPAALSLYEERWDDAHMRVKLDALHDGRAEIKMPTQSTCPGVLASFTWVSTRGLIKTYTVVDQAVYPYLGV